MKYRAVYSVERYVELEFEADNADEAEEIMYKRADDFCEEGTSVYPVLLQDENKTISVEY